MAHCMQLFVRNSVSICFVEMFCEFGWALSELSDIFRLFTSAWCIFIGTKAAFCIFPGNQGVDNEV